MATRSKASLNGESTSTDQTFFTAEDTIANEDLSNMSKDELINIVLDLRTKNSALSEVQRFMEKTNERLVKLEREQNLNLQYIRRDSVEISGIPANIEQDDLEGEVIKIFDTAGVIVNGAKLDVHQIQACHRTGKKGKVIVKTLNRKFAMESLYCGANLIENSPYDNAVYINNSFCKEFGFLNFLVRKAKKNGHIRYYKVKKGITSVQVRENSELVDITHKIDLVNLGISIGE